MFGRIVESRVTETVPFDPAGLYPGDFVWVSLPEGVGAGFWRLADGSFTPPNEPPAEIVASARAKRIAEIKREARARIEALDWKVERAREWVALGHPAPLDAQAALEAVLEERQDIRDASTVAEAEVGELDDLAAIAAFAW